jgi:hypothetical protein
VKQDCTKYNRVIFFKDEPTIQITGQENKIGQHELTSHCPTPQQM